MGEVHGEGERKSNQGSKDAKYSSPSPPAAGGEGRGEEGLSNESSVDKGGTGIGLANLRARLDTLYGSGQRLELISRPNRGVTVLIQIPWRTETVLEAPGSGSHS